MNLVLIGYRGTGKSAIARLLADRLQLTPVSLDEEIVRAAGLSIPQIVEQHGWPWFRDLEAKIVRRTAAGDHQVLDTGGGVILRDDNIAALKSNGLVFWLKASVPEIVRRIDSCQNRPSLTGTKSFVEEVAEVLKEREPRYFAAADFEIATDNQSPETLADLIAERWRKKNAS